MGAFVGVDDDSGEWATEWATSSRLRPRILHGVQRGWLAARYEELTLREIADILGVSESRVSQLHMKAILRLKSRLAESP